MMSIFLKKCADDVFLVTVIDDVDVFEAKHLFFHRLLLFPPPALPFPVLPYPTSRHTHITPPHVV